MVQAYLENGQTEDAVFEFFVRKLPANRNFYMAAGLEQALGFLEGDYFSAEDIDWLHQTERFGDNLLDYLREVRFTGAVHAMPEGTVFFPNEPILRVTAPLPVAQLVETRLINILHYQSLIATKAARQVQQAGGKTLVDFGMRRAHGADAGLMAARASYIAGFSGTATVLAGKRYGVPIYGTMAHSFIQVFDDEVTAFEAFALARPDNLVLLIDTYDTEAAARKIVRLAPDLAAQGISISAVRIDSGDLAGLSKCVRGIFDEGGLDDVKIFVSGGLDEYELAEISRAGAPVDGFGIGTSLTTSSDLPALDCAYKLAEYAGIARRKRSTDKATLPGRKQVWRRFDQYGCMAGDVLTIDADRQSGMPLVECVMRNGKRVAKAPSLDDIRERASGNLAQLPDALRGLDKTPDYPVEIATALRELVEEVDQRQRRYDKE
jgi:nicotinate phosphoribosyltransferase